MYGRRERRGVQSISKFGEAKDPGWELQPWVIFTLHNGPVTLEFSAGLDDREKWQPVGGQERKGRVCSCEKVFFVALPVVSSWS